MNAPKSPRQGGFLPQDGSNRSPDSHAEQSLAQSNDLKIGKTAISREEDGALLEIFTMTMEGETILLLPTRNWAQLDAFKWRARCILPRIPAGLEISWNQLKVAGETVSPWDPDACARLEKAFNDWLNLERKTVELSKEKSQAPVPLTTVASEEEGFQIKLDLTNLSQPRLKCLEGNQTVKIVALNLAGLNALVEEGFLRKPNSLKVGALHNWVELDGKVFNFKEDPVGAAQLEKALNEQYRTMGDPNAAPDVVVSVNPASPSGFDIQFPATPLGVAENRKRHLNEETIKLLQDAERCRVLRSGITARFAPPDLVFKVKTSGGGERNLDQGPDSTVSAVGDDGKTKTVDLSQPVNLLNLGVRELNAVFNHPAINRRSRLAQVACANYTRHPE